MLWLLGNVIAARTHIIESYEIGSTVHLILWGKFPGMFEAAKTKAKVRSVNNKKIICRHLSEHYPFFLICLRFYRTVDV